MSHQTLSPMEVTKRLGDLRVLRTPSPLATSPPSAAGNSDVQESVPYVNKDITSNKTTKLNINKKGTETYKKENKKSVPYVNGRLLSMGQAVDNDVSARS